MDYYEIQLTLNPNTEVHRDVLSALLADIGFESFVESEQGLTAYISENEYSEKRLSSVLEDFPLPGLSVQYQAVYMKSKNWNEEWENHFFQPIIIDNQVVIHSSFHKNVPALKYDIVIDPKMAFGTGHHATTAMMVSYLLETELEGKSALDMGCGTAVLAILAAMKNARQVRAIDNDEWAYKNALENIRLNQTPYIQVELGDANLLGKETYDFIFANINRNILLNDIPVYAKCMHQGSSIFMSGFFNEDIDLIVEAGRKCGLEYVSEKKNDQWAGVELKVKMS
ncbi:MAG: 50S ribosomal protein L11 methyltransferase [Dysgonamonadaceae bacterium]|jgi:ribosomal protein L11 methyltransferase|nr:50S ribosomal protein L11 methyltransferase [Dysgonamonadaceae bacterium]